MSGHEAVPEGASGDAGRRDRRLYFFGAAALLAFLAVYLLESHYIKAYSDPVGWLMRAERMLEGDSVLRRAPVFPAFLIPALKLLGPAWIFLANLPLVLLLAVLVSRMTVMSFGAGRREGEVRGVNPLLAGFAALAIFVMTNRVLLVELVNPFREPLAFSLMIGAVLVVLHVLDRGRWSLLFTGGLLLGLASGTRETCILVLPALGLLYLHRVMTDRDFPWLKAALLFGSGLFVGLIPLLLQNAMHSGHFWLPSYAARRWESGGTIIVPDEFPIPGMQFSYLFTTGRMTLHFFADKYGWWGMGLLAVGLGWAVRRREIRVLLLLLPALLTNLLFYSFYFYVKGRYLLVVDLFAAPLMGVGAAVLLTVLAASLGRWKGILPPSPAPAALGLAALFVVAPMVVQIARPSDLMKVWDVGGLRRSVEPHLEKPYCFIAGNRHQRQLLSWLFRAPYVHEDLGIEEGRIGIDGFDKVMAKAAEKYGKSCARTNIYSYGRPVLLRNWFDFVKVLSFGDMPRAPDRYGERLEGSLYLLSPWSATEVSRVLEVGGGKSILLADFYRLWDGGDRTSGALFIDGVEAVERIPNGPFFVEIPQEAAGDGRVEVTVTTDVPLPAEPILEVRSLDEEWSIPFGAGPRYWFYPLLSEEMIRVSPLNPDAAFFFDSGTVTLPSFAGPDRMVIAIFEVELFQDDPFFATGNTISFDGGGRRVERILPGRRRRDSMAVSLGRGTGRLQMVPVRISTSLPSYDRQREMKAAGEIEQYGYVRLRSVTMTTLPLAGGEGMVVDLGTSGDALFLREGFYQRERFREDRPVRWTSGRAVVSLPSPGRGGAVRVRVVSREVRPESLRRPPKFFVNGRPLPEEAVDVREGEDYRVEYTFEAFPEGGFPDGVLIDIVSEPWVPAEFTGSGDTRPLGILVDTIGIEAADGGV